MDAPGCLRRTRRSITLAYKNALRSMSCPDSAKVGHGCRREQPAGKKLKRVPEKQTLDVDALQERYEFPRMDPKYHCPEACRKVQSLIQFSMSDSLEILTEAPSPLGDWKLT